MTLDEFINEKPRQGQWIDYPGFEGLYVRWNIMFDDCITLANMQAIEPGSGNLTRLIGDLLSRGISIFVENALTERLEKGLKRRGFVGVPHLPYCFFLEAY